MDHAARMARFEETALYVVITEFFCAGRPAVDVLHAVLDAGVGLIQLREKDMDTLAYYRRAEEFRELTARHGALLIVDDRVDIALGVGADGVHLGQTDLPIAAARRIAPDLVLGASSHNLEEALAAQSEGASYVNIGPVFATQTKSVPTGVAGLDMLDIVAPHLKIPLTTMGGIKRDNIGLVLARGARHAAVVTAVTAAPDPGEAARELDEIIRRTRCG